MRRLALLLRSPEVRAMEGRAATGGRSMDSVRSAPPPPAPMPGAPASAAAAAAFSGGSDASRRSCRQQGDAPSEAREVSSKVSETAGPLQIEH